MRTGTANTLDHGLEQLFRRQSEVSLQQEKLSSGRRVNRASDDPAAAALAERTMVRLSRVAVEQRGLETQRDAITAAESALGEANGLMQNVRELVVAAGNAGYSATDRASLAQQISDLREQLFELANRTDANGVALFGGLGGAGAPFVDTSTGVQYQASPGQRATADTALPGAMNGQAIWMDVPSGNGTFEVALGAGNTGSVWTDPGSVIAPGALTGNNYTVTFAVAAGITTYSVVNTTTAATVASGLPYLDGAAIQFDGMSVTMNGTPQNGDTVTVAPSTQSNVFKVVDDVVASITNAPGDNRLAQAVALSLVQMDTAMERLQSARSQAGRWLNRADSIAGAQEERSMALQAEQSRAVDLDMAKGISDFNKAQTGYQAALQSYAQIQRMTLFDFIN